MWGVINGACWGRNLFVGNLFEEGLGLGHLSVQGCVDALRLLIQKIKAISAEDGQREPVHG